MPKGLGPLHHVEQMKLPLPFSARLFLCVLWLATGAAGLAAPLEAVRLSRDGKSLVRGEGETPFRVWGVNYDRDTKGENGRLLEDYWEEEWAVVVEDFQEMRELGANVVRLHLQLGKFMKSADTPDAEALRRLGKVLRLAEETGLYLDITGLGCYHRADTPVWYDAMDEKHRWAVQERFWTAVARTCRESDAVFCYDLMNEPVIGGNTAEGWVGGELGGKCYVQRLTLEQGGRTAVEIAKAWAQQLTTAIRAVDSRHLITVGVIPWAQVWPGAKPVFYAPGVAEHFDFVSIHLYPDKGGVDKALAAMSPYEIGKPLLIEETFPLKCSMEEMEDFLEKAKERSAGFLSFYWGRTAAEYAQEQTLTAGLMKAWLEFFAKHAGRMK